MKNRKVTINKVSKEKIELWVEETSSSFILPIKAQDIVDYAIKCLPERPRTNDARHLFNSIYDEAKIFNWWKKTGQAQGHSLIELIKHSPGKKSSKHETGKHGSKS